MPRTSLGTKVFRQDLELRPISNSGLPGCSILMLGVEVDLEKGAPAASIQRARFLIFRKMEWVVSELISSGSTESKCFKKLK